MTPTLMTIILCTLLLFVVAVIAIRIVLRHFRRIERYVVALSMTMEDDPSDNPSRPLPRPCDDLAPRRRTRRHTTATNRTALITALLVCLGTVVAHGTPTRSSPPSTPTTHVAAPQHVPR